MSADPAFLPQPGITIFETFVRVRFHEVDALGHVNNAAYLTYLEQAAIDHASALGLDLGHLRALGGVFVARRHDIVFLRPAIPGDLLRVVTWLDEPRGARVDRHYLVIRDPQSPARVPLSGRLVDGAIDATSGDLIVRATTEWVFTTERGQPRRVPAAVIDLFHSTSSG